MKTYSLFPSWSLLLATITVAPGAYAEELAESELRDAVTQFGITWEFHEPVLTGRFITGDWWVVDDGDGITVTAVTPTPEAGRNGSMLNPVSGGEQAFDDRTRAAYDPELAATFPLVVSAGDSLVSTISRGSETEDWAGAVIDSKVRVRTAAVLTVLHAVPPADAFRPAYTDRSHTLYRTSQIAYDVIPKLDASSAAKAKDLSYYVRGLERPWMLFVHEWPGRDVHPHQNMKGYHRSIGEFLSEASLMMLLDLVGREELINHYVQLGIDYYHVGITGLGDSSYYVAPPLFAGHFLGDPEMKNAFVQNDILATPRDYADFYYYADRNDSTTSEIVPEGETWSGHKVFFRNNLAANRGYEHLHPSEWHLASSGADVAYTDEDYRITQDTHQHVGMVLAARILGLKEEWGHDATFDMMDRWMEFADPVAEHAILSVYDENAAQAEKSSKSGFVDEMWSRYRFAQDTSEEWRGHAVDENGNVDAEPLFGLIHIVHDPWIYVYKLSRWVYFHEKSPDAFGDGWFWFGKE